MKNIYKVLAAIMSATVIGGVLYENFQEPPAKKVEEKKISEQKPVQGFGVINLEQIKSAHPDGATLDELLATEKRLRLELEALMIPYQKPKEDNPPKIDEKPFDESAREKNMQNFMSQLSELKAKRTQLTEKYRRESREEYLRRRDEVRDVYLNRALNITLKLQNADNLKLTDDEIRKLQVELDELVIERNQKQVEMLEQWTAELNERVEKEIAPEEERIRREAEETLRREQDEALQKVQNAQERNKNLMEQATKEIEARKLRRKETLAELEEVTKNRIELENKILDSIVEEVGKLAAFHKLEAVLINTDPLPAIVIDKHMFDFTIKKSPGAKIYVGKDTPDLTADLLKTIELKKE